ncbi:ABC transporter permease [Paenibacillus sp. MMS20-IR301]|uniref:ABC transporter permease n=1 Tax=Paenibacillus sp. MMS20-IR301 TaxID=2895946 RepID=UPI0028EDE024|nr:ABC transporter permease [Paenibacillus sp. MMS20-IR301]WNS44931.1 ABC transporter permease [Paenibacillus sp. MMS20-IR301]
MWHTAIATALRNQRANLRAFPWSFTLGHIIDGAYLVLVAYFSYVYLIQGDLDDRFLLYTGTDNYLAFAIIGGTLNIFCISMMMNVSRALITEWREGTLEALLLSPSSRNGYFLGTAIQQFYRSGFILLAVLVFGLLAGLRLPAPHLLSVLAGALVFILSIYSMALVLGSVMLLTRDTYIVQNTLFAVTTLLCGFQFPRQYLPGFLQNAAEIFPLTSSLQLLRGALLNGSTITLTDLLPAFFLSTVYIAVGIWCISRVERQLFEKF